MARQRVCFVCLSCGADASRWFGRCTSCGEWNPCVEEPLAPPPTDRTRQALAAAVPPMPVTDVDGAPAARVRTGISEFDRALGGGIVPGSGVLVGGDPGIGKSTLLLQGLA